MIRLIDRHKSRLRRRVDLGNCCRSPVAADRPALPIARACVGRPFELFSVIYWWSSLPWLTLPKSRTNLLRGRDFWLPFNYRCSAHPWRTVGAPFADWSACASLCAPMRTALRPRPAQGVASALFIGAPRCVRAPRDLRRVPIRNSNNMDNTRCYR